MWDDADDFGDLEPRSFTMRSAAFFPFTNDLMDTDLMINATLQESYCWQSAEGHPIFVLGLSPAGGIQDQPTAVSVDILTHKGFQWFALCPSSPHTTFHSTLRMK
jgi:hypothetical protein